MTTKTVATGCTPLPKIVPKRVAQAQILEENYIFMRQLIDALRIVRGNAQDLVLPESGSDGMIFLARRMGSTSENWQEGASLL